MYKQTLKEAQKNVDKFLNMFGLTTKAIKPTDPGEFVALMKSNVKVTDNIIKGFFEKANIDVSYTFIEEDSYLEIKANVLMKKNKNWAETEVTWKITGIRDKYSKEFRMFIS